MAMRFMVAVVVIAAWAAVFRSSVRAGQEPAARTAWSGIYTEAQAKRGDAVYTQACAGCHAPDLTGDGQAPPLVGKDFNAEWNDLSMDDLFQRVRTSMPADAPGTLKPADVADVMAFMLNKGNFPAGQTELQSQTEILKAIKFLAAKPQG
jgi:mono/diheme cytochrome c family protein